ncbi:MAG: hypothetical protein ACPGR8_06890 [Limisphaerales bacterium]
MDSIDTAAGKFQRSSINHAGATVPICDLKSDSPEVTSQPHIHPVAVQYRYAGITTDPQQPCVCNTTSADFCARVETIEYVGAPESTKGVVLPGMTAPDPPNNQYFYHSGICTMLDIDYNNFDDQRTGTWYGVPICGRALGRRAVYADTQIPFTPDKTNKEPDDAQFYHSIVPGPVQSQGGAKPPVAAVAWAPYGCDGTNVDVSPECKLYDNLNYVNVADEDGDAVRIAAQGNGVGALPVRFYQDPESGIEVEQFSCSGPDGDNLASVEPPRSLIYDACKQCKSDLDCPGGYECIWSYHNGISLMPYEIWPCPNIEGDHLTCVPAGTPIMDMYLCQAAGFVQYQLDGSSTGTLGTDAFTRPGFSAQYGAAPDNYPSDCEIPPGRLRDLYNAASEFGQSPLMSSLKGFAALFKKKDGTPAEKCVFLRNALMIMPPDRNESEYNRQRTGHFWDMQYNIWQHMWRVYWNLATSEAGGLLGYDVDTIPGCRSRFNVSSGHYTTYVETKKHESTFLNILRDSSVIGLLAGPGSERKPVATPFTRVTRLAEWRCSHYSAGQCPPEPLCSMVSGECADYDSDGLAALCVAASARGYDEDDQFFKQCCKVDGVNYVASHQVDVQRGRCAPQPGSASVTTNSTSLVLGSWVIGGPWNVLFNDESVISASECEDRCVKGGVGTCFWRFNVSLSDVDFDASGCSVGTTNRERFQEQSDLIGVDLTGANGYFESPLVVYYESDGSITSYPTNASDANAFNTAYSDGTCTRPTLDKDPVVQEEYGDTTFEARYVVVVAPNTVAISIQWQDCFGEEPAPRPIRTAKQCYGYLRSTGELEPSGAFYFAPPIRHTLAADCRYICKAVLYKEVDMTYDGGVVEPTKEIWEGMDETPGCGTGATCDTFNSSQLRNDYHAFRYAESELNGCETFDVNETLIKEFSDGASYELQPQESTTGAAYDWHVTFQQLTDAIHASNIPHLNDWLLQASALNQSQHLLDQIRSQTPSDYLADGNPDASEVKDIERFAESISMQCQTSVWDIIDDRLSKAAAGTESNWLYDICFGKPVMIMDQRATVAPSEFDTANWYTQLDDEYVGALDNPKITRYHDFCNVAGNQEVSDYVYTGIVSTDSEVGCLPAEFNGGSTWMYGANGAPLFCNDPTAQALSESGRLCCALTGVAGNKPNNAQECTDIEKGVDDVTSFPTCQGTAEPAVDTVPVCKIPQPTCTGTGMILDLPSGCGGFQANKCRDEQTCSQCPSNNQNGCTCSDKGSNPSTSYTAPFCLVRPSSDNYQRVAAGALYRNYAVTRGGKDVGYEPSYVGDGNCPKRTPEQIAKITPPDPLEFLQASAVAGSGYTLDSTSTMYVPISHCTTSTETTSRSNPSNCVRKNMTADEPNVTFVSRKCTHLGVLKISGLQYPKTDEELAYASKSSLGVCSAESNCSIPCDSAFLPGSWYEETTVPDETTGYIGNGSRVWVNPIANAYDPRVHVYAAVTPSAAVDTSRTIVPYDVDQLDCCPWNSDWLQNPPDVASVDDRGLGVGCVQDAEALVDSWTQIGAPSCAAPGATGQAQISNVKQLDVLPEELMQARASVCAQQIQGGNATATKAQRAKLCDLPLLNPKQHVQKSASPFAVDAVQYTFKNNGVLTSLKLSNAQLTAECNGNCSACSEDNADSVLLRTLILPVGATDPCQQGQFVILTPRVCQFANVHSWSFGDECNPSVFVVATHGSTTRDAKYLRGMNVNHDVADMSDPCRQTQTALSGDVTIALTGSDLVDGQYTPTWYSRTNDYGLLPLVIAVARARFNEVNDSDAVGITWNISSVRDVLNCGSDPTSVTDECKLGVWNWVFTNEPLLPFRARVEIYNHVTSPLGLFGAPYVLPVSFVPGTADDYTQYAAYSAQQNLRYPARAGQEYISYGHFQREYAPVHPGCSRQISVIRPLDAREGTQFAYMTAKGDGTYNAGMYDNTGNPSSLLEVVCNGAGEPVTGGSQTVDGCNVERFIQSMEYPTTEETQAYKTNITNICNNQDDDAFNDVAYRDLVRYTKAATSECYRRAFNAYVGESPFYDTCLSINVVGYYGPAFQAYADNQLTRGKLEPGYGIRNGPVTQPNDENAKQDNIQFRKAMCTGNTNGLRGICHADGANVPVYSSSTSAFPSEQRALLVPPYSRYDVPRYAYNPDLYNCACKYGSEGFPAANPRAAKIDLYDGGTKLQSASTDAQSRCSQLTGAIQCNPGCRKSKLSCWWDCKVGEEKSASCTSTKKGHVEVKAEVTQGPWAQQMLTGGAQPFVSRNPYAPCQSKDFNCAEVDNWTGNRLVSNGKFIMEAVKEMQDNFGAADTSCRPSFRKHAVHGAQWSPLNAFAKAGSGQGDLGGELEYSLESYVVDSMSTKNAYVQQTSAHIVKNGIPNPTQPRSTLRGPTVFTAVPNRNTSWPNKQIVARDYTQRPWTTPGADTRDKATCRCGDSLEYACIVYDKDWRVNNGGSKASPATDVWQDAEVRVCGWSWGGLGLRGSVAGAVGLFIGSDYAGIRVAEANPLKMCSVANGDDACKEQFTKLFGSFGAPRTQPLLDAMNYGTSAFDARVEDLDIQGTILTPDSAKYWNAPVISYPLPGACVREPWGRVHSSTYVNSFAFPSQLVDETLYGYCQQERTDLYVHCAGDPKSALNRAAWCKAHPEAEYISIGASPGPLLKPCALDKAQKRAYCVLFSFHPSYPRIDSVYASVPKDYDVDVVVAPFSEQVRLVLQARRAQWQIGNESQSFLAAVLDPSKFKPVVGDYSLTDSQFALISSVDTWYKNVTTTDKVSAIRTELAGIVTSMSAYGWFQPCEQDDNTNGVKVPIPPSKLSDGTTDSNALPGNLTEQFSGSCVDVFNGRPTLSSRGNVIERPNVRVHSYAPDQPVYVEAPVQRKRKTDAGCTVIFVTQPGFVLDATLIVDQRNCTSVDYGVMAIVGSGKTLKHMRISNVTVLNSPKALAVGILGGDPNFGLRNTPVDITNTSFGFLSAPDNVFRADIALARVTADNSSVEFQGEVRILLQNRGKNKTLDFDLVATGVQPVVVNIGEVTSIFGDPFEQTFFHPIPNHNHLLAVTAVVLGSIALILLSLFVAIYVRGSRQLACDIDGKQPVKAVG